MRQREFRWRALAAPLLVGVAGLLVALAFDRWYSASLIVRERKRVQGVAASYATSLEGFFSRRTGRLAALRAFVEAEPSVEKLRADFPTFSLGLSTAAPGVRAFQLVRDGIIVATWPTADSAQLVGYDLLRHPDPEVVDGVRRAMVSDSVVISGPVPLLQGGNGLIARRRVRNGPPGGPDMVVVVLDLQGLLSEAEVASPPPSVRFGLVDRRGIRWQGTEALASPTRTAVRTGDGEWTVLAEPAAGWNGSVAQELKLSRAASALIWMLLVVVVAGISGRQDRLTSAVGERTMELERANDELRRKSEERLALEEQLLHSQKMEAVGTLAGGIAHDFNNLLTAIVGFGQLADQQIVDLQDISEDASVRARLADLRVDVTEILKASDRASMLTAQLLAFSRRQRVMPERVNVKGVVHDLERMLRRLIGETVTLVTDVGYTGLPVMADSGQLTQVIVNLVVNARDAMPNGGTIRIGARAAEVAEHDALSRLGVSPGSWVLVTVADDGAGMSPEVQARIFEPFYTTKRTGEGTGLGLSTVYGIVKQAGGHVFVESEVGRGTTFTVALPMLPHASQPVSIRPRRSEHRNGEMILVVEDEAGLRRLVSEILSRQGYMVRAATNGIEALELLESGLVPDLVISDVVMPRMGGQAMAAAMEERNLRMPVLFMSGYQEGDALPDTGRFGFIGKPFTPDALVDRVSQILSAVATTGSVQP